MLNTICFLYSRSNGRIQVHVFISAVLKLFNLAMSHFIMLVIRSLHTIFLSYFNSNGTHFDIIRCFEFSLYMYVE
jgi:hypothetical protein